MMKERNLSRLLIRMPMTEAVTTEEGGEWIPFRKFAGGAVHAIRFVGGHEWDAVNGWRITDYSSSAGKWNLCRARGGAASLRPIETSPYIAPSNFYGMHEWGMNDP